jgi:xanthine dehydrogenase YagS FAD-binding subunit
MKPFAYAKPKDLEEALALLSERARPKGGGMDLLDLAKGGVSTPDTLLDLGHLSAGVGVLEVLEMATGRRFDVESWVTLADLAESEPLREQAPAIAEAAEAAATPLVRNVATLAGNLLQRPRCAYFRDPFFDCLKRGGKSCPAMEGDHSEGAIFGNGKCCAVHPSNLAVALVALDAKVTLLSNPRRSGDPVEREVSVATEFFVAPEEDPLREARIATGDLISRVSIPYVPASAYVEVDQKQSFDWASASAAVALRMEGGKVTAARVALGAVAPVPLLSEAAAAALVGRVPDEKAAEAAAEAAVKGATPLRDNGHKVQHLRVCVKRAVLKAAARGT